MDKRVLLLGMEYRYTANNYLSFKPADDPIHLSPIAEVNQMLIADKIQNRKDFEIYHKGTPLYFLSRYAGDADHLERSRRNARTVGQAR